MSTLGKQLVACQPKYALRYMRSFGKCSIFNGNGNSTVDVLPCEKGKFNKFFDVLHPYQRIKNFS